MQRHSTIEVLGCSGSIGIPGEGTTSFLIDDDLLIDAGTGLCNLPFSRLEKITDVVLTHSHLDHICGLPFLIDSVGVGRQQPLQVHGSQHTLDALAKHVFNEDIWPDFTRIPNPDHPVMQLQPFSAGDWLTFGERRIKTVSVNHTVPTVAVVLHCAGGQWCFSGDTHQTDALYEFLNQLDGLRYFFVESAFSNAEQWLADLSRHLCPSLLFAELTKLNQPCEVWITHLKPKERDQIRAELLKYPEAPLQVLSAGLTFTI